MGRQITGFFGQAHSDAFELFQGATGILFDGDTVLIAQQVLAGVVHRLVTAVEKASGHCCTGPADTVHRKREYQHQHGDRDQDALAKANQGDMPAVTIRQPETGADNGRQANLGKHHQPGC